MIQIVINTQLLRELDENKLINAYARLAYLDKSDIEDDLKIKENLLKIFDWDYLGSHGLEIFCSKFEKISRKDINYLVNFIKDNSSKIITYSYKYAKKKRLEKNKEIIDKIKKKELQTIKHYTDENYQAKQYNALSCTYNGKYYSSRRECLYKEKLTKYKLYKYLKETGQM